MVAVLERASISIIGAGNLGSAVAKNLAGYHKGRIIATRRNIDEINWLKAQGIETTCDNNYALINSDITILAVKPANLDELIGCDFRKDKLIISTVAGKEIEDITTLFDHRRVIRAMPNMGLGVGTGAIGYSIVKESLECDEEAVKYVFGSSGYVFKVEEQKLAMVTVGACFPGLIAQIYDSCGKNDELIAKLKESYQSFLQKELDKHIALEIVKSSFATVHALLLQGQLHQEIYKRVASPGGGTEKAHNFLVGENYYESLRKGNYSKVSDVRHLEIALNHFKGK